MQNVACKVFVKMCIGSADIIAILLTAFRYLFEFWENQIVAASISVTERTHPIVDLFAPVNAQNNVTHLLVDEVQNFIIQQNAVRGNREAEFLIVLLLLAAPIGHQLLDHIKIHQRLAAEKVHFQIHAASGILNEEIQRLLSHFKTHQSTAAHIFAFVGKAVFASQIAVVRDMQAQRLHHCVPLLEINHSIPVYILTHQTQGLAPLAEQGAILLKGTDICNHLLNFRLRDIRLSRILFQHRLCNLRRSVLFPQLDHIISQVVHHMDTAAVDVQDNIISVALILMNHFPIH